MIVELTRGFVHAVIYGALTTIGLLISLLGGLQLFVPQDLLP